jgi:cell division protein FtsB
MEFVDVAYRYLTPVFLCCLMIVKNKKRLFIFQLIAVANVLLIFHSVFVARQLYAIYQLAMLFKAKSISYHYTVGWFDVRLALVLFLPFLFLFKKFSSHIFLTIILTALLWWDQLQSWSGFDFSMLDILLLIKIFTYACLFIAAYALLWLLKKLPYQVTNR